MPRFWVAVLLLILTACGSKWTDSDTRNATNAARSEVMVEAICAEGQPCKPSQVRALERSVYCANASMLFSHGQSVPDAGIQCQP